MKKILNSFVMINLCCIILISGCYNNEKENTIISEEGKYVETYCEIYYYLNNTTLDEINKALVNNNISIQYEMDHYYLNLENISDIIPDVENGILHVSHSEVTMNDTSIAFYLYVGYSSKYGMKESDENLTYILENDLNNTKEYSKFIIGILLDECNLHHFKMDYRVFWYYPEFY